MFINEVCKECSLTKKAVEYYVEQGLVTPAVLENGYRDFSDEDAVCLKKVSVLRGLGLAVADIKKVLANQTGALDEILRQKNLEITLLQEKQGLIRELAKEHDWTAVSEKLRQLEKKQTILERMRKAFPGYYGSYVCCHFAPYLDEPVVTDGQKSAFDTIIAFLDSVSFDIPEELREYYDEVCGAVTGSNMSGGMEDAVRDIDKFIDENREAVETYLAYKQSDEYKQSLAYRLAEAMRQFASASGYNDIFIPAMCRLSSSYREYHKALDKADERFLQRYPGLREVYESE